MMRVLCLCYEFPPLGGAGIRRSLILSENLTKYGIEPVLITGTAESYTRDSRDLVDEHLLQKISHGLSVHRIHSNARSSPFSGRLGFWYSSLLNLTDDISKRWTPQVMSQISGLISSTRPSVLYCTIPPFSVAGLAASISQRFGLPLVVDFRDSWSGCGHTPRMTLLHHLLVVRQERRVVRQARRVNCVTPQIGTDLLRTHTSLSRDKMSQIPNAFDHPVRQSIAASRAATKGKPFVIGHVGSFYYSPEARESLLAPWYRRKPTRWTHYSARKEDWLYRSPHFFFQGLRQLFSSNPEYRQMIRVEFAGKVPEWLKRQVEHFSLKDVVCFRGYLKHVDCIQFQGDCDALLITAAKVLGGEDYSISSKSFEYVAAGKPILAVTPPGAQRDFFSNSGLAAVCSPDDPCEVASAIATIAFGGRTWTAGEEFLHKYNPETVSSQMAAVFRDAAKY